VPTASLQSVIDTALHEDAGRGDPTTDATVPSIEDSGCRTDTSFCAAGAATGCCGATSARSASRSSLPWAVNGSSASHT